MNSSKGVPLPYKDQKVFPYRLFSSVFSDLMLFYDVIRKFDLADFSTLLFRRHITDKNRS